MWEVAAVKQVAEVIEQDDPIPAALLDGPFDRLREAGEPAEATGAGGLTLRHPESGPGLGELQEQAISRPQLGLLEQVSRAFLEAQGARTPAWAQEVSGTEFDRFQDAH